MCSRKFIFFFNFKYRLPVSGARRDEWINSIEKYQDFDRSCSQFFVCSLHFKKQDFYRQQNVSILQPDAVPSVYNTQVPAKRGRYEKRACEHCNTLQAKLLHAEKKIEALEKQVEEKQKEIIQLKDQLKKQNWFDRVLLVNIFIRIPNSFSLVWFFRVFYCL